MNYCILSPWQTTRGPFISRPIQSSWLRAATAVKSTYTTSSPVKKNPPWTRGGRTYSVSPTWVYYVPSATAEWCHISHEIVTRFGNLPLGKGTMIKNFSEQFDWNYTNCVMIDLWLIWLAANFITILQPFFSEWHGHGHLGIEPARIGHIRPIEHWNFRATDVFDFWMKMEPSVLNEVRYFRCRVPMASTSPAARLTVSLTSLTCRPANCSIR